MSKNLARLAGRQLVDPDNLDCQVVGTAPFIGFLDNRFGSLVEIGRAVPDRGVDETSIGIFINAIGRENKNIALLDTKHPIIDLDLRIDAHRAAEIALLRGNDDAMILGQLFQTIARDAIDARIPNMKKMRGSRFDDDRAERTDVALVHIVGILAASRLGVKP